MPAFFVDRMIFVSIAVSSTNLVMQVDTGSPGSVLDPKRAEAVGLSGSDFEVTLGDVAMGRRTFTATPIADDESPAGLPGPVVGAVGNDFWKGYSVGIDFASRELWITAAAPAAFLPPAPDGLAKPTTVACTRPEGYVVVPCSLSDAPATTSCLFDTGAPPVVALEVAWSRASKGDGRRVPGYAEDSQGNTIEGYWQRAAAIRVGEVKSASAPPVLVFPEFPLLSAVAKKTAQPIAGIVGMRFVEEFFTVIDFPNDRILFFPRAAPPIQDEEFIGYGFIAGNDAAGDLVVASVVAKSSAETAGLRVGDGLADLGGPPTFTAAGVLAGKVGEKRHLTLLRGGQKLVVDVTAEDLLPAP